MENYIKRIESDKDAEKCLLSIREIKADYERQVNCCKEMIEEYQSKIKSLEEKQKVSIIPYESQLMEYFTRVEKKVSKTQESYKLPSGKIKLKFKSPEIKRQDEYLIQYLNSNNMNDKVKISQSVDWAELKKELTFVKGKAIDKNGEIVPGIELVEREPEFVVEVD